MKRRLQKIWIVGIRLNTIGTYRTIVENDFYVIFGWLHVGVSYQAVSLATTSLYDFL